MPRVSEVAEMLRPSYSADRLGNPELPPLGDRILLVEDNEDDVLLFRRLLRQAHVSAAIDIVADGETAIRWLSERIADARCGRPVLPRAIFLDLKLPGMFGLEVLRWIRAQPELERTLAAICSSSTAKRDVAEAKGLGAQVYFTKYPTAARLASALAETPVPISAQ